MREVKGDNQNRCSPFFMSLLSFCSRCFPTVLTILPRFFEKKVFRFAYVLPLRTVGTRTLVIFLFCSFFSTFFFCRVNLQTLTADD